MLGKKTKDQEVSQRTPGRSGAPASAGTSVISREMRINGDCIVEGRIRIEGTIVGDVQAAGLELARSGSVKGDLTATQGPDGEPFVIAGEVDGRVHAPKVEVGPNGSILGGVEADEAKVRGRVEKGIVARKRLILEETAVVEGDVRATNLALKEGGQVNGTIVMGDRATSADAKPLTVSPDPEMVAPRGPRKGTSKVDGSESGAGAEATEAGEGAAA